MLFSLGALEWCCVYSLQGMEVLPLVSLIVKLLEIS